uniref:ShKT domain-containing protein n=1 Tax=Ditylenchus dipsaci TaxID=166011 RepID=A0A915EK15_9BILA
MLIACASTFGLCNKGGCRDTMDGCITFKDKCHNDKMKHTAMCTELNKKCARTLGYCDPKCQDTSKLSTKSTRNLLRKFAKEVVDYVAIKAPNLRVESTSTRKRPSPRSPPSSSP